MLRKSSITRALVLLLDRPIQNRTNGIPAKIRSPSFHLTMFASHLTKRTLQFFFPLPPVCHPRKKGRRWPASCQASSCQWLLSSFASCSGSSAVLRSNPSKSMQCLTSHATASQRHRVEDGLTTIRGFERFGRPFRRSLQASACW